MANDWGEGSMAFGTVFPDILSTVGGTPLVSLNRFLAKRCNLTHRAVRASVLLKCEFFNPLSSVKDRIGRPGSHQIQGIGAGFVPKNLDRSLLNGVELVSSEDSSQWARCLAEKEGLLVGVSTGANVAVAVRLTSRPENAGKTIVTFACSSGERYLSTPLYQLMGMRSILPETACI